MKPRHHLLQARIPTEQWLALRKEAEAIGVIHISVLMRLIINDFLTKRAKDK